MGTESDLMDLEIIKNLNPPKEPDVIDLTNIDDKKEHDSGEHNEPNKNKKYFFAQEKQE